MERRLDHDLDRVRQTLLRMGGVVEGMVAKATQALLERQTPLSVEVIQTDHEVDQLEIEIDEACHLILGTKQPTASDLRFLVAVMKINSDLERIGDSAVNIAQSVEQLNEQPPLKPYIDLPHMSELVQAMVRKSLDAFVNRDVDLATEVCRSDDDVDGLYKQIFRELLTYMIEDPKTVSRALHLLLISRNMERIADHATNIAEDVIYYVSGRDIRHSSMAAPAPAAQQR
ncbi:MAG TPA: phosphate signaling complex protein PhoU [Thermoanaerobaculia bacterium]|jgi:phosphate transport system protein|nr:phosphate signaling complex protein PhoU [Thermoanaerobaculia bacterium]